MKRDHQRALVVCTALGILTWGADAWGEESNVSTQLGKLSEAQRLLITREVERKTGWRDGQYDLRMMAEWDNDRVPVVVAIPKIPDASSPKFVALPDGRLTSVYEPDALDRIVRAAYPKPAPGDARALAQLALWFGHFGQAVGTLPVGRPSNTPSSLPRADLAPVLATDGDAVDVDFYTYDYSMRRMFDCRLTLTTPVKITCRQLAGSKPSREEAPAKPI